MCKRKDQNLKHHICLFVKRQIFVSYITSSQSIIQIANKVPSQNGQIKFTNCQRNRLKKRHLNLFTFTVGELHFYKLKS